MNIFDKFFKSTRVVKNDMQPVAVLSKAETVTKPIVLPCLKKVLVSFEAEAAVHDTLATKAKLEGKHNELVIHSALAERLRHYSTLLRDAGV